MLSEENAYLAHMWPYCTWRYWLLKKELVVFAKHCFMVQDPKKVVTPKSRSLSLYIHIHRKFHSWEFFNIFIWSHLWICSTPHENSAIQSQSLSLLSPIYVSVARGIGGRKMKEKYQKMLVLHWQRLHRNESWHSATGMRKRGRWPAELRILYKKDAMMAWPGWWVFKGAERAFKHRWANVLAG